MELHKLEQLESENKFILDENPIALFGCKKVPPRFNSTVPIQPLYVKDINRFQGRILPQSDPYCRASFLVQVKLPEKYPFERPEITFLDPIYHLNVDERGRHCCCWFYGDGNFKPTTPVAKIIKSVIQVIDHSQDYGHTSNFECADEVKNHYEIFYKKALENTLSYGRPRY